MSWMRRIEPIVRHGLREIEGGAAVEHTLREVALMGVLVGRGVPPAEAIRRVERREGPEAGLMPGESWERMHHPGMHGWAGGGYCGVPMYGAGMPWGMGGYGGAWY